MAKAMLPGSLQWDNYWGMDRTKKFTRVSWSKRRIMNILGPYVNESACALDAGCGSGFFSKYFCDSGLETFAIDYSQQALAIAANLTQGKAKTAKVDLLKNTLSDILHKKFDIIFTDGLLEHFTPADQDAIIRNFISVLSPRGRIVTFVPNRFSPWELIRPFFMPGIEEKPFVLKELIDVNERNGLRVCESGGINTLPFYFSPDKFLGKYFGMLLYTISVPNA